MRFLGEWKRLAWSSVCISLLLPLFFLVIGQWSLSFRFPTHSETVFALFCSLFPFFGGGKVLTFATERLFANPTSFSVSSFPHILYFQIFFCFSQKFLFCIQELSKIQQIPSHNMAQRENCTNNLKTIAHSDFFCLWRANSLSLIKCFCFYQDFCQTVSRFYIRNQHYLKKGSFWQKSLNVKQFSSWNFIYQGLVSKRFCGVLWTHLLLEKNRTIST